MGQEFTQESRVFAEHIEEWRQTHLGQYVLIKDDTVLGFFPSLDKAFREGTERFGLGEFFVKQIVPRDAVNVSLLGRRLLTTR